MNSRRKGTAMTEPSPPKATSVDIIAIKPSEADTALIGRLNDETKQSLPAVAYVVKVQLKRVPDATAHGWALHVGDLAVPKYWAYDKGIYFKVYDPELLSLHKGGKLRFSANGVDFTDTGLKLPEVPSHEKSARALARLPSQEDVLK